MGEVRKLSFTLYVDRDGNRVAKSHPDAQPRGKYRSAKFYGSYVDELGIRRRVALSSDRKASRLQLAEIEATAQRRRSGLSEDYAKHLATPISKHVAAYQSHLKAKGNTAEHVVDTVRYVNLVASGGDVHLLRDLSLDRVELYLNELQGKGLSNRTVNAYRNAIKSFGEWCVKSDRWAKNPLAGLSKLNEQVDPRHSRRTLTGEQLAALIAAAEASPVTFRRLSGPDRAVLYQLAIATGLRANELATLTTDSLRLEGDSPCVVVEAAYSKRRRRDEQPLPGWLAVKLRAWLDAKRAATLSLTAQKLFPGSWSGRAYEMLKGYSMKNKEGIREWEGDLAAAGIAYRDDAGHVFDFHALRHQFITTLAAANVNPKVAQTLARHSSVELTLGRYTHLQTRDVAGALEVVSDPTEQSQANQATGTESLRAVCAQQRHSMPNSEPNSKLGNREGSASKASQVVVMQGDNRAEGMGLEPTTPCGAPEFQSGRVSS